MQTPGHARLAVLTRHLTAAAETDCKAPLQRVGTSGTSYNSIKVEVEGPVATIIINRPRALNTLTREVANEVTSAALALDADPQVRAIILTGEGTKAFVAGADVKELAEWSYDQAYSGKLLEVWDKLLAVRKPIIAAVNGYALGGGCELAMICDIVIASDNAAFGQPEITLGIIPGLGGTQRLTRAVGKSRAMEMILTGERVSAEEAARMGLVSRVVPQDQLMVEAKKIALKIAALSAPVVARAKESCNAAFETTLAEGLRFERATFWGCLALEAHKERMAAFTQKRKQQASGN